MLASPQVVATVERGEPSRRADRRDAESRRAQLDDRGAALRGRARRDSERLAAAVSSPLEALDAREQLVEVAAHDAAHEPASATFRRASISRAGRPVQAPRAEVELALDDGGHDATARRRRGALAARQRPPRVWTRSGLRSVSRSATSPASSRSSTCAARATAAAVTGGAAQLERTRGAGAAHERVGVAGREVEQRGEVVAAHARLALGDHPSSSSTARNGASRRSRRKLGAAPRAKVSRRGAGRVQVPLDAPEASPPAGSITMPAASRAVNVIIDARSTAAICVNAVDGGSGSSSFAARRAHRATRGRVGAAPEVDSGSAHASR